jgi:hypothetical protein
MMKEWFGLLDYSAPAGPAARSREVRNGMTSERRSRLVPRAVAERANLEQALHIWIQTRTKPARIADSPRIQDLFRWKCELMPRRRPGLAPPCQRDVVMPALGIGGSKGPAVSDL